jgi:hypothetical protein
MQGHGGTEINDVSAGYFADNKARMTDREFNRLSPSVARVGGFETRLTQTV